MDDVHGVTDLVIGVLGGTGPQGRGLALRFAVSGLQVLIGSRDAARAATAADAVNRSIPAGAPHARGEDNTGAAEHADLVVVAVPWEGHAATLGALRPELAGKIVVDCVNPIGFDDRGPHALDIAEGSAAEQAAVLLPDSRVVAAFHHLSATLLADPSVPTMDCDVMVLGDDRAATDTVRALADLIPGLHGVYAGRLRNAHQVEALTANLIAINRRYKAHAGIRITDIDR